MVSFFAREKSRFGALLNASDLVATQRFWSLFGEFSSENEPSSQADRPDETGLVTSFFAREKAHAS